MRPSPERECSRTRTLFLTLEAGGFASSRPLQTLMAEDATLHVASTGPLTSTRDQEALGRSCETGPEKKAASMEMCDSLDRHHLAGR